MQLLVYICSNFAQHSMRVTFSNKSSVPPCATSVTFFCLKIAAIKVGDLNVWKIFFITKV